MTWEQCQMRVHVLVMTQSLVNQQTLISASKGLMNGDPLIVCALTMWSSSNNWISSTADRMDTPCKQENVKEYLLKSLSWYTERQMYVFLQGTYA